MKKYTIIFILVSLILFRLNAQGIRDIAVGKTVNGKKLTTLLRELEQEYTIDFIFNEGVINALTVNGIVEDMDFTVFMDIFLNPYKMEVVEASDHIFFIVKEDWRWTYGKRSGNFLVFPLIGSNGQKIKGIVKDNDTNEPIAGAQVIIPGTENGVLTNAKGSFEMIVPNKLSPLEVRYMGYETASFVVGFSSYSDVKKVEFALFSAPTELEGVTVTAEAGDHNIRTLVPGVEKLGIEEIKRLPTFMGVVDPIKSLVSLPGVSTVGELSSGFNVRGGETGQNLILQDGAIIFNPTHMFGFFSAFNPDIVQSMTLNKGGGPAKFGGRISSVLDVKLRNGNAVKHTVTGGAGIVSSRLGIEGPIIKNRSSYFIGGRIAYPNWLLKSTDNIQLINSSAHFYDVTGKIFHEFNVNNFISVTGYRSYDDFQLASDSTFSWQTTNISIRWNHNYSEKLFSALNLSSSNYYSKLFNTSEIEAFSYRNAINNLWLKYDLVLRVNENIKYNFGLDLNQTQLEPGQRKPLKEKSNIIPFDIHDQNNMESSLYLQGNYNFSDKWAAAIGLRYGHFWRYGKDVIYVFDFENYNGRYPAIADSVVYKKGELISSFGGFEPRIAIRYRINDLSSLKASYYRTFQYLHLISNTTAVTPQDYWISSGPYLEPERGDQLALGYFRNFKNDAYEFSLEGFYKKADNAVDYIEGADITLNKALEAGLLSGKGLAYGLELLVRKNEGRFKGWVAYTYSRSLRKFKGDKGREEVNNGNYYPATYDQPHNLSVVMNYQLGARSVLSANFSYSTGRPITIPVSKFSYDAYLSVLNYSERNAYRIPDYHRLDLSLTLQGIQRKNSDFRSEWVFSIYNVYSRNNAYSIFFNQYGTAKKLSVLGSVFPSISYNLKF